MYGQQEQQFLKRLQLKLAVSNQQQSPQMKSPLYDLQAATVYKQSKSLIKILKQCTHQGTSIYQAFKKVELHVNQFEFIVRHLIKLEMVRFKDNKLYWIAKLDQYCSEGYMKESIENCKIEEKILSEKILLASRMDWFYKNYDRIWGNMNSQIKRARNSLSRQTAYTMQSNRNGVLRISGFDNQAIIQQGQYGELTIKLKPRQIRESITIDYCKPASTIRFFSNQL